jgi:hypothetical protein
LIEISTIERGAPILEPDKCDSPCGQPPLAAKQKWADHHGAMNLNITYDQVTLNTAPSTFFTAVNYVVNLFDSTFTNNVTINIKIGYGELPYDNSVMPPLGKSVCIFSNPTYLQVRQILTNEAAAGSDTLPLVPPITGNLTLTTAQAKALGLLGPSTALDGWIGIASNAQLQHLGDTWSFSPTATPTGSQFLGGQFYIVGVLEHELSEVMGRTSLIHAAGEYSVMDLYRYQAAGVRQTGIGDASYFSIDSGQTNLGSWNNAQIASGDLGDWAPSAGPSGVFKYSGADAFLNNSAPGQINSLSATDLTLMKAIGWNIDFLSGLSMGQQTELIYIGYFNRSADGGGLSFWEGQDASAQAGGQSAALALTNIANSFTPQAETIAIYPFLANANPNYSDPTVQAGLTTFVESVYGNLFGHAADSGGLAYWVGQIEGGAVGLGPAVLAIANGAQGADATILQNKLSVASDFTTLTTAANLPVNATFLAEAKAILAGVDGISLNDASVTAAEALIAPWVASHPHGASIALVGSALPASHALLG